MLEEKYNDLDFLEILNHIEGFIKIVYNINSDIPVIYFNKKWNALTLKLKNTDSSDNPDNKKIYNFLIDYLKQIYLDIKTTGELRKEDIVLDNGIKIEMNSLITEYKYSTNEISGYIITIKIDVINALTIKKNKIFKEITGSISLSNL